MSPQTTPKISICICTRNRPHDLSRALSSITASTTSPHEVIVSDDSTDDATRDLLATAFPHITRVQGPRRGLGANRNTALGHASGTHILFIDDDVLLGQDFVQQAQAELLQLPPTTILSGIELNHGTPVHPHKPSFLGYQAIDYQEGDTYETVVINATLFPIALFAKALFDENLVYGYEEMDFASRAVLLHGHHIVFCPALINAHFPSPGNREFYAPFIEASRIYVTFKRYCWVERRIVKAMAFLLIAYAHILAHDLRRKGLRGMPVFVSTVQRSKAYINNPRRYL
jgi:glycosyltransferase involved in cell wall biosynthesis